MTANSFFLGGIDLADVVLARVDERDAVSTYPQLIEEVRARCGEDVASLFAEPIKGANRATGVQNVAWYCGYEGAPFALRQLEAAGRQPVVELLRQRLLSFSSLFADSRNGPVFASWLNVLSPESLMAVGGQPVIKNWGMLPTALASSEEARDTHFRNGVGLYLPSIPTPPFVEIETQSFAGRMAQLSGRETARAARSGSPPPSAPAASIAPGSIAPAAASLPSPSSPIMMEKNVGRPWLAPVVACAVAAAFVAVLAFGHILRYPAAPVGPDTAAIAAQQETNQALRDRLDELRRKIASPGICQAPPGDPTNPHATDLRPMLPPAPTLTKIAPPTPDGKPQSLASALEKATVIVLMDKSLGSGFFISDRYIVTNHHVVGNETSARVASKSLGGIVPAKVVAVGAGAERGTQDIAVLEIDPKPGTGFLELGIAPDRLQQVTASGYPGAVLETIDKDSALPEANFTQGIVTSHQSQEPAGIATIIHTAQIGHGNSGGPLVDAGGCAVGINSWLSPDAMGDIIFSTYFQALDASELRRFLTANNITFTASDTSCTPVEATPPAPIPTAEKH